MSEPEPDGPTFDVLKLEYESALGMYHFLRVVESDAKLSEPRRRELEAARERAGYGNGRFTPFYVQPPGLSRPSGAKIAGGLALLVPAAQLAVFLLARLLD